MLLTNLFPSKIIPDLRGKIVVLIKFLKLIFKSLVTQPNASYTCLIKKN